MQLRVRALPKASRFNPQVPEDKNVKVSPYLLEDIHGEILCVQESPKVKTPKKNTEALYVLGALTGFYMFIPGEGHAASKTLNWK